MKRFLSFMTALLFAVAPLSGCSEAANLGVIGGADGPTSIVVGQQTPSADAPDTGGQENNSSSESDGHTAQGETPNADGITLGPAVTGAESVSLGSTVLDEEGWYSSKEEVALYLMQYNTLPGNYITKAEARDLGWEGGSLEPYAPGMSIGGDRFGNYEGSLPDDRNYTECDIDTQGAESRGAKRIVFSDDGLIFYTEDHYETFTLLSQGESYE